MAVHGILEGPTMINRITVSKDVHLLILETCEYSGLYGKRNFEDVIKLRTSDESLSWITQIGHI